MARPASIPIDDLYPRDEIALFLVEPAGLLRGYFVGLKRLDSVWTMVVRQTDAGQILRFIPLAQIQRIERHRKTKLGREGLPNKRTFKRWLEEGGSYGKA